MKSSYMVLTVIKNEPLRIIPLAENFKGIADLIVLLDPDDQETESILIDMSIAFIKRPACFYEKSQKDRTEWMLKQVKTDYVLIVMASFYVPMKLLDVFDKVARDGNYDGVIHATNSWSHGRLVQEPWIRKRASACYFFNRNRVNVNLACIHNEFPIDRNKNCFVVPPVKSLSIHIFRDDDMSAITLKEVAYAEVEAKERLSEDPDVTLFFLIYKIIKSFSIGYLRMGGFRFGVAGFIYHINHSIQQFLVYSRLWELQQNKTFEENRLLHVNMRMALIAKDRMCKKNESR